MLKGVISFVFVWLDFGWFIGGKDMEKKTW